MIQTLRKHATLLLALVALAIIPPAAAEPVPATIGMVVMHGKGGAPGKHVAELAAALEGRGYRVANLEMPWSGRRNYDVNVAAAESQVAAALDDLRRRGAQHLFVAGHSQGGLFALHCGGRHAVHGVIAIAPGGSVGSPLFREKLGAAVDQARRLVAEGKADEAAGFLDYEGAKGSYPVVATPANYLSWFDPAGAMNQASAARNLAPQVPVLYIVPTRDYPALLRLKQSMFDALPRHPLTRLHEPDADHLGAPWASVDEIVRWTSEVAGARAATR